LRDHVKTTISDLGYGDYGEWLIGHQHSTYYNQLEQKRQEVLAKVELYLTYLDVSGLEAQSADMAIKLEQSEEWMRGMHEQLGALFRIMAIEDQQERQKQLAEEAKRWVERRLYRPTSGE
jgi:hypothetical protein